MSQSDIHYVAPGDIPESTAHQQITESLNAVGLRPDDFIHSSLNCRRAHGEHVHEDSYMSGFMDAVELVRCEGSLARERDRLRDFVGDLLAGQYFGGGWADKIMDAAKEALG